MKGKVTLIKISQENTTALLESRANHARSTRITCFWHASGIFTKMEEDDDGGDAARRRAARAEVERGSARAGETRSASAVKTTLDSYRRDQARVIMFVMDSTWSGNMEGILNDDFEALLGREGGYLFASAEERRAGQRNTKVTSDWIRGYIDAHVASGDSTRPFPFTDRFSAHTLELFLSVTRKKTVDEGLSVNQLSAYRAAVFNLFRLCWDVPMPSGFEPRGRISRFRKGLGRLNAQAEQDGNGGGGMGPKSGGKRPIPTDFYKEMLEALIKDGGKDYIFAAVHVCLAFSMMARSGNVSKLRLDHMKAEGDHVEFMFPRCVRFALHGRLFFLRTSNSFTTLLFALF